MPLIDIAEAKENLQELIEAAISGEVVAIAQDNQPVVKLISVQVLACQSRECERVG